MATDLDPGRVRDALRACEIEEKVADDFEREAARLRATAAARRVRWGLPPRGSKPPE